LAGDEWLEARMMKRKVVTVLSLFLALAAAAAFGQSEADLRVWQELGLSEEQREQARGIVERTQKEIREARAEIDVRKAELRRLLIREPVDMAQVEKQLRASLEWEYRLRLAQISRQVELRRVLGDRDYARLMQAIRERRRSAREADAGSGGNGGNGSGRGGGPRR
jgi:hypothetical protein